MKIAHRKKRRIQDSTAGSTGLLLGMVPLLLLGGSLRAQTLDYPFERVERSIESGAHALQTGDFDRAMESFSNAEADDGEKKAIVDYNVGSALMHKASRILKQAQPPSDGEQEISEEAKVLLEDAEDAFKKAYSLSQNPVLRSDAALAQGNTRAQKGELKEAIESYRNSIVANPSNHAARRNLMQSLRLLKAQPPPPPSEGGGDDENDEEKDEEKDEQDPNNGENQDQKKADQDKKEDGDQKDENKDKKQNQGDEQDKDNPEKKKQSGQEGEKDPQEKEQKSPSGEKDKDEKDPKEAPPAGQGEAPPMTPEELSKEEAKRLLDALRNREKPLNPHLMRGTQMRRVQREKNW
jgi:Ca-activated chloride channel homolog